MKRKYIIGLGAIIILVPCIIAGALVGRVFGPAAGFFGCVVMFAVIMVLGNRFLGKRIKDRGDKNG